MDKDIILELSMEDLNYIGKILVEKPYKEVVFIVNKIEKQVQEQTK